MLILHNIYRKEEAIGLVTDGVYSYVRHPMYTGLLLSAWSHPTMVIIIVMIVQGIERDVEMAS